METTIILYKDGTHTTIKSRKSLTIAYCYICKFYSVGEFEPIFCDSKDGNVNLLIQKGCKIDIIIERR